MHKRIIILISVFAAALVALWASLPLLASGGKTAASVCPGHQTEVWDAAMSYYLEHGLKTNDLIDPQELTNFFPEGQVPRCPDSTSNYAPFRILDGPKCPEHPIHKVPARVAKLKENVP